jgi:uncharacterized protein YbaR (Trm112 family)
MIPKQLLKIICCPVDKSDLREEGDTLVCLKCNHAYPVKNGIPILLPPKDL